MSRISLSPSNAIGVIGSPPGVVGYKVGESGARPSPGPGIGIENWAFGWRDSPDICGLGGDAPLLSCCMASTVLRLVELDKGILWVMDTVLLSGVEMLCCWFCGICCTCTCCCWSCERSPLRSCESPIAIFVNDSDNREIEDVLGSSGGAVWLSRDESLGEILMLADGGDEELFGCV